ESGRHAEALNAITNYLDMGAYSEWNEDKKLDFLTKEVKRKRPLIPPNIETTVMKGCDRTIGNLLYTVNWKFGA
ncbi:Phosphoenolpyruvate carboxylase 4, partial [Striga hermonthica]